MEIRLIEIFAIAGVASFAWFFWTSWLRGLNVQVPHILELNDGRLYIVNYVRLWFPNNENPEALVLIFRFLNQNQELMSFSAKHSEPTKIVGSRTTTMEFLFREQITQELAALLREYPGLVLHSEAETKLGKKTIKASKETSNKKLLVTKLP